MFGDIPDCIDKLMMTARMSDIRTMHAKFRGCKMKSLSTNLSALAWMEPMETGRATLCVSARVCETSFFLLLVKYNLSCQLSVDANLQTPLSTRCHLRSYL